MGLPIHYSLELPQRCLDLLDGLWPHVQEIRDADRPDLGPLTSTFLISMSMPIINLPIERVGRLNDNDEQRYIDDRPINSKLASEIDKVLNNGKLKDAPFFAESVWSFTQCRDKPFPNIARGLPEKFAEELTTDNALAQAAEMNSSQWRGTLRNALAHGGIAFLDKDGRSTIGGSVMKYAFASRSGLGKNKKEPKSYTELNILSISEVDYFDFLRRWVVWLQDSGIAKASDAA